MASADDLLDQLLDRCRRDHHAWISGDGSGYALPDDGTIMGAVGGYSRGGAEIAERQLRVSAQWRRGSGEVGPLPDSEPSARVRCPARANDRPKEAGWPGTPTSR